MSHGFRVLHVSDYASSYEGAFIRQLRMLDEQVRERGGRPSAFAMLPAARARGWANELADDGWQLEELPASGTHASRAAVAALVTAIERAEPDVVHVHFGTYDLAARAAMRRLRRRHAHWNDVRLVWHYRTALEEPVAARGFARRLKDHVKFVRASRDVDLVVGVTNALAEEAVARGVAPERARGVVAGCDTDTFRRDADTRRRIRAELGVADDDVLLMHMGWHWHRKGGDLLAEAVRSLEAGDGPRIVACSIGAPEHELLGSVRALPITDRVHEYHQAADIFVSASRSEGFGNGLVEAMACERVAVAACADGQIETFDGLDGVLPVAVEDARALTDGIRDLIRRRASWPALGSANRAHVVRRHSMRRWASEMADTYAELAPRRLPTATQHRHEPRVEDVA